MDKLTADRHDKIGSLIEKIIDKNQDIINIAKNNEDHFEKYLDEICCIFGEQIEELKAEVKKLETEKFWREKQIAKLQYEIKRIREITHFTLSIPEEEDV